MSTPNIRNVFVVSPGRTGTAAMSKALQHLEDFTCGHETAEGRLAQERFPYPSHHVEVDNRLTWMLGTLVKEHSPEETLIVIIKRDQGAVARSYLQRFLVPDGIVASYSDGIIRHGGRTLDVAQDYVAAVYDQLDLLHTSGFEVAEFEHVDMGQAVQFIFERLGDPGSVDAALEILNSPVNSSRNSVVLDLARHARLNSIAFARNSAAVVSQAKARRR